jgi:hypothetical protein
MDFSFGGKKYKDPFAKEVDKVKKQKKGAMVDPFGKPTNTLNNLKQPKGFGSFEGQKQTKGIGFGGFGDLESTPEMQKGLKKTKEKKKFDMFGGMEL